MSPRVVPPADSLALTAVVYGAVLTGWTLVSTVRGAALRPVQHAAGAVLGAAGLGLALAYGASMLAGHRPPSLGTTVGYCLAAALLLPLAWPRDPRAMSPRIAAGSACIASLALTVVVVRMRVTW